MFRLVWPNTVLAPTFLLIYDSRDSQDGLQILNWQEVFVLFLGKLIWKVDYVRIS